MDDLQLHVVHGVVVTVVPLSVVALRGSGVRVARGILNLVERSTACKGEGDECVPQAVGRDVRCDAGLLNPAANDIPHAIGSKRRESAGPDERSVYASYVN